VCPIPDQHRIIEVMLRSIQDDGMDVEGGMILMLWYQLRS